MTTSTTSEKTMAQIMDPKELLEHWQGHRRLTRRVIEAFPEEEFFTYTLGGMRPFAEMVMELLAVAGPGIEEIVSGETAQLNEHFEHKRSKEEFLELWDKTTETINSLWNKISPERFSVVTKAFGQYEGAIISHIFYYIDNEIHHRGQAYVYLRTLGIEPPLFFDRS